MTASPGSQGPAAEGFRSGFVTIVGRPNVGKSTLVNQLVGTKVAITSAKPQTTRTTIRGVRTTSSSQIVFLDTPGLHKPRTALGERTNERARASLDEVDAICVVIDASEPIGRGDGFVCELAHAAASPVVLVVNKIDAANKAAIASHLASAAAELGDFDAFVPVSARTGEGVAALLSELEPRLPEGPQYYPEGVVTDQPELFIAAELLREQLLRVTRDEVPHSITVEVEPIDDLDDDRRHPDDVLRLRAVVRVERDSQKGIVIGRDGSVLKDAATAARHELEALLGTRVFLETAVRVDRDWQRRPHALDRLGY
ncbi:MAG: GTPase Era [Actinobacteria bacterium]|nr:GTPase Era [Actinomycetota bacterium]